MPSAQNLIGQKFSRLIVVDLFSVDSKNQKRYSCICDCGNTKVVLSRNLKNGNTKSCGCLQKEIVSKNSTKTGQGRSPLAKVWQRIKQSCLNPKSHAYEYYGGRGITICDKWLTFEGFFEDMGATYQEGLEIDRNDVNKGYCPENCSWEDRSWQAFNTNMRCSNTSGKTGVYWNKKLCKWETKITKDGLNIFLGYYFIFEEAVVAREAAEIKYFGRLKGN